MAGGLRLWFHFRIVWILALQNWNLYVVLITKSSPLRSETCRQVQFNQLQSGAKHNGDAPNVHVLMHLAFQRCSWVVYVLHIVSHFPCLTNTPEEVKRSLPAAGLMGLHPLAARPRPRWWTSDSELCERKKFNSSEETTTWGKNKI